MNKADILSNDRVVNDRTPAQTVAILEARLVSRKAVIGIVGLGYVGLPLAMAVANAGFSAIGFDIDAEKIVTLDRGQSYIDAVDDRTLQQRVSDGYFSGTSDFDRLAECDVIVICVPTPLSANREPNLSYVEATALQIARHLRPGQLVLLESTTYPGTTENLLVPILETSGLKNRIDFFIGFSPEREDPGNRNFHTASIPKVVAGSGPDALRLAELFYGAVVERTVAVSTPDTAEAVKITENIFRAVNVALVNELKLVYDAMGIDIWEVIDAAATKPFGYMPFYPGPGLGGHCIPIDPFYLTWRAREFGIATRFVELAGEINVAMPAHVLAKLEAAIDQVHGKSLGRSRVLLLGIAYKKNVSDMRESPSLVLIEKLLQRGCDVDFHDPHVAEIPPTREHAALAGHRSVSLDDVASYDAVLIATDHDNVDYAGLAGAARLIVDTRNAIAKRGLATAHLVKA
jgi:UDP-N-acetyl-D-glucosamine dehydrogenase